MSLCVVCCEIPWRMSRDKDTAEEVYRSAYAKLARAAGDRFMWGDGSGRPAKFDRDYWPYIRAQDKDCSFCQLAIKVVRDPSNQPTYHGGFRLKRKNFYGEAWKNKAVWIQLLGLDDRPLLRLWVGDAQPEHFVRPIEPQTTFGKFQSLPTWHFC